MKTQILTAIMLLSSFLSIGQTKHVEVGGIIEPNWAYRSYSTSDFEPDIKFTGLFAENDMFYIKPVEVSFSVDIVDCTGDSALSLWTSDYDCIFLFLDFEGYNDAPIESINQGKEITMSANTQFNFTCNNTNYTLQADGEIEDSDTKNYKLTFSKTGCETKQILVAHEYINSTEVEILFIGDLDGDSEPDIIVNAADNYENRWIMLFLSSTKQEKELLHLEAEEFNWFDC
jgi:hypothetical protein